MCFNELSLLARCGSRALTALFPSTTQQNIRTSVARRDITDRIAYVPTDVKGQKEHLASEFPVTGERAVAMTKELSRDLAWRASIDAVVAFALRV